MNCGYAGKILRVNLTTRSVGTIDTAQYESWGGGHGMGSAIFWDLCEDKTVSGFDPGNVVTIMGSPLAGTLSPGSPRCEVQGIGVQAYPIEWFTRSNFGGRFSSQLKYAGWDGIVIEGRADRPVWLNIINDQAALEDAGWLWGKDAKETQQEIWRRLAGERMDDWQQLGDALSTQKPAVLCIGPAGENLSRIGVLLHDSGSAAGQGGFGGIFGSKNLKAISVCGTGSVRIAKPGDLIQTWLWYKTNFRYNVDAPRYESPIANFPENFAITGIPGGLACTAAMEPSRPHACHGCPVACRRRTSRAAANEAACAQKYWPLLTLFPMDQPAAIEARSAYPGEFPGALIEMTDLYGLNESRFHVTDLADRYGLNVFELCVIDMYLIQLYYMGLIGSGQAIDCDLPFDAWASAGFKDTLLKCIAFRHGIGDALAEGIARAAERWGRYKGDTETRLLNLAYWGYMEHNDSAAEVEWSYGSILGDRDINEHSFNLASHQIPRIADLTKTEPIVSAARLVEILASKVIPYQGDPFMFDYSEGPTGIYSSHRVKEIAWHRHYTRFWTESLGYCDFLWPNFINPNAPDMLGATPEGEPRSLNAVTGRELSFKDGMEVGRRIWNLDRAI